jgi:hypothetical protein
MFLPLLRTAMATGQVDPPVLAAAAEKAGAAVQAVQVGLPAPEEPAQAATAVGMAVPVEQAE